MINPMFHIPFAPQVQEIYEREQEAKRKHEAIAFWLLAWLSEQKCLAAPDFFWDGKEDLVEFLAKKKLEIEWKESKRCN